MRVKLVALQALTFAGMGLGLIGCSTAEPANRPVDPRPIQTTVQPAASPQWYFDCGDTDAVPCVSSESGTLRLVVSWSPFAETPLPTCKTEDSHLCLWPAGTDKEGRSRFLLNTEQA